MQATLSRWDGNAPPPPLPSPTSPHKPATFRHPHTNTRWLAGRGCLQGDVRRYEDCERMAGEAVTRFGRLDILVNCAAGNFLSPAEQLSSNGFRTVMEIDSLGTFNTSRAAFEALKASGDAVIINISMTLHYGATWWQAHASAAKVGRLGVGRAWGELGVGLSWVCHGVG